MSDVQQSASLWWTLRPELRSMILTFAYAPDDKLRVLARAQCEIESRLQRRRFVESYRYADEVSPSSTAIQS